MVDNTKWLADAKARLAVVQGSTRRAGSIAAKVEALRPEIESARAAGKTWKQIALDIFDGEGLNEDAVRIAFRRRIKVQDAPAASTKGGVAKPAATPKSAGTLKPVQTTVHADMPKSVDSRAGTSLPNEGLLADMFAPLLDARDTRGRGSDRVSLEEGRS